MCMGNALTEHYVVENGRPWTNVLAKYKMPSIKHTPEIISHIVEHNTADGPFGAKGVGETGCIATTPAILNAIHDAVGAWICDLPVTPEKVLRALREAKGSTQAAETGR